MITLASELEETRSDDRSRNYNIHPVKERREERSDTIKSGSCNSIFSWSCSLLSGFCCCHVKKYCTMSMVLSFFFKTALRELGLALFCGMARGMAMLVGYICPDWNISTFAWIAMTLTIPSDLGDLLAFLLAQACQHFFFKSPVKYLNLLQAGSAQYLTLCQDYEL